MPINENIDTLSLQAFKALVAKGIYCLLFPLDVTGGTPSIDTSKNLLYGIPIGNITAGDESVDSEEYQDQLAGGIYKNFAGGAIDPSDVSMTSYFAPDTPQLNLSGVINSTIITPQFILVLAVGHATATMLQGFFAAGVNYNGGNGIQGDYGKIIKSNLKFKISGQVKRGFAATGTLSKTLYSAGIQIAMSGKADKANTTLANELLKGINNKSLDA